MTEVPAAYACHADALRSLISGRVVLDEPMSAHTTLGVGGPADVYAEVMTTDDLAALMGYVNSNGVPWMVLGGGANLLVSDKGIRGVVIAPKGEFERISADGTRVTSGAAATISAVADFAAQHDLCGLEGVGTVPGTVGGAIVMNAGTHRGYIDKVVESVAIVTETGVREVFSREDCGFTYRGSRFQTDRSLIIASVVFKLIPGDGTAARRELDQVRQHRADTQPKGRSAGCFFKNAPNQSAGKLIESAGGMGMREGGAVVSDIHANFIINENNATASDLRTLAERVRQLVRDRHDIELEYEVRMVGEW
jgi:UDP-N-acetylmuramate dehydrogenase